MSSAITWTRDTPISVGDWMTFCRQEHILHSPRVIGKNVFHFGGLSGIEITFGEANYTSLPEHAHEIIISTFFLGDLRGVARIARHMLQYFGGNTSPDLELQGFASWPEGGGPV